MNEPFGKQTFDSAEALFKDGNLQAFAEKSMAASKDVYDNAAAIAQASRAVFDAYRSGVFGSPEVTRYPLAQAALAHEDIAARRKSGTLVPAQGLCEVER